MAKRKRSRAKTQAVKIPSNTTVADEKKISADVTPKMMYYTSCFDAKIEIPTKY